MRAALELTPTRDLVVRLSVLDQDLKRDGIDFVDYDPTTGRPVTEPATRYLAQREPYQSKINLASADVEYNTPSLRFNSITSLQRVQLQTLQDNTPIYGPMLESEGVTVQSRRDPHRVRPEEGHAGISPDIQGQGCVRMAGRDCSLTTRRARMTKASYRPCLTTPRGPALLNAQLPSKYDEAALYGNATWNVSDSFSLTGGLRVARNRQTYQQTEDGLFAGESEPPSKSGETSKTYLLTAKYALTPKSNVYARAASGYRPGGPNAALEDPTTGKLAGSPTFQHDSLWSYEAGYKADFPTSGWSVQADAFLIDWKNIQQFFAVDGITLIANGGTARSRGVELALNYKQGGFSSSANLAYTDAYLTDGSAGLGSTGAPLPNSAKLSGSVDAGYAFETAGLPANVDVTVHGVTSRNAGFAGSQSLPNYHLPGYALVDAKVGVTWNKLEFNAFARNLLNHRAQLSAETTYVPLGGTVQVVQSTPLTLGFSVSADFQ